MINIAPASTRQEPANESTIEVRTINGLKQRRLFDLAISYAEQALQDDRLNDAQKVDVAVALVDAKTQKAFQSRDAALWQDAVQTAKEWQQKLQIDRSILLRVQEIMVGQSKIERTVLEVQADSRVEADIAAAKTNIVDINSALTDVQKTITEMMNRQTRSNEAGERLEGRELLALRYNVEYQLARTFIFKAALVDQGQDVDRADALTQAMQQLEVVLQSVGPEESLWWTVQADRMDVASGLRDFAKSRQVLNSLVANDRNALNRIDIRAAWLRSLVRQRDFDSAFRLVGKNTDASDSPKLDLARIELFVALAGQQAGQPRDPKNDWQKRALELTSNVEKRHGGYWRRLANLAVVGTAASTPEANSNLDLLFRVADEAQRKKNWAEAIKALDSAATKASGSGNNEVAYRAGFRAASIQQQTQQYADAAFRFNALATNFSNLSDSHSAALMACWNQARIVGKNADRFAEYEAMLERLVQNWPDSASADQGRIWLASIRSRQKNVAAVVQNLLSIPYTSPLFGTAVKNLRAEMFSLQKRTDVTETTRRTLVDSVRKRMERLANDEALENKPDNWSDIYSQIVLQIAELKFVHRVAFDGPSVSGLLDRVLAAPSTRESVLADALALRYVALGNEPGSSVVDAALFEHLNPGPDQLRTLRLGLAVRDDQDPMANDKATMLLSAKKRFESQISALDARRKQQWDILEAKSVVQLQGIEDGMQAVKALGAKYRKDAAVQFLVGEFYLKAAKSNESKWTEQALGQWRRIAKGSRRNSENWFAAKLNVARLLVQLGKQADARKMLEFMKAVPPGWTQSKLASEFDQLFEELSE